MDDPAVAAALASGEWKQMADKKGKVYFYHPATKKTVWDLKRELSSLDAKSVASDVKSNASEKEGGSDKDAVAAALASGEWKQMADKKGKVYFYHPATKKTVWDLEKELGTVGGATPASKQSSIVSVTPEPEKIIITTSVPLSGPELAAKALESGEWKQMADKKGKVYFFNPVTKATAWDLAKELEPKVSVLDVVAPLVVASPPPALAPTLEMETLLAENRALRKVLQFQEDEVHRLKFTLFCGGETGAPRVITPIVDGSALQVRLDHVLDLNKRLQSALSDERKQRNLCAHCSGFLVRGKTTTVGHALGKEGMVLLPAPTQMSDDVWYYSVMNPNMSSTSYVPQTHAQHSWLSADDIAHRPTYAPREPDKNGEQPSRYTAEKYKTPSLWQFPTAKYLNQS